MMMLMRMMMMMTMTITTINDLTTHDHRFKRPPTKKDTTFASLLLVYLLPPLPPSPLPPPRGQRLRPTARETHTDR